VEERRAGSAWWRYATGRLVAPFYSPDLNPIELAFSELKPLLRSAAERIVDVLRSAIGRLLQQYLRPAAIHTQNG
jgi:transposase